MSLFERYMAGIRSSLQNGNAQIAQLVEHQTVSPKLVGLIPRLDRFILGNRKCPLPLFQVKKWTGTYRSTDDDMQKHSWYNLPPLYKWNGTHRQKRVIESAYSVWHIKHILCPYHLSGNFTSVSFWYCRHLSWHVIEKHINAPSKLIFKQPGDFFLKIEYVGTCHRGKCQYGVSCFEIWCYVRFVGVGGWNLGLLIKTFVVDMIDSKLCWTACISLCTLCFTHY